MSDRTFTPGLKSPRGPITTAIYELQQRIRRQRLTMGRNTRLRRGSRGNAVSAARTRGSSKVTEGGAASPPVWG